MRTITIASTTVRANQYFFGFRITLPPHLLPPEPNALHGKFSRIRMGSYVEPSTIVSNIVDAIRNGFRHIVGKVVAIHLYWLSLEFPLFAAILVFSNQFLF